MVSHDLDRKDHGLIGAGKWVEIGISEDLGEDVPTCEHARDGVVVHGSSPGRREPVRLVTVCAKPRCPVHRPKAEKPAGGTETPGSGASQEAKWKREEEKRKAEADRWKLEQHEAAVAFLEHVKALPVTPDLVRMVAERGVRYCGEILGEGYELTAENLGQALAADLVGSHDWTRRNYAKATEPFGFAMPPRAPVAKKAAPKKR